MTSNFMRRLELPPTLRTPTIDEVPKTEDVIKSIERSHIANIVEGFIFNYNNSNDLPFKFYAEINIDNSRLWNFFKFFVQHLPDEISLIFNHADGDAVYTKYEDKNDIIKQLDIYETELTQDCFLEYGAIHQTDNFLEEIFVDCSKYLKYWGTDEEWFRTTMKHFQIFENPNLNFIDEFPKVREALTLYQENILETEDLIQRLETLFPIADL